MPQDAQIDLAAFDGLPTDPDSQPEIHTECVRIAQRPQAEGRFALGLLPADEHVGVPALALHLGWALSRLARRPVGLVDANVRYPAFPVQDPGTRARVRVPTPVPGATSAAGLVGGNSAEMSIFVERRIDQWLTLLSPRGVGEAGAGVPQLALIVERYRDRFAHLVVDLTGFQRLGDHLNAIALLDGVIIVARSRLSREAELVKLKQEIPDRLNLGLVLTG